MPEFMQLTCRRRLRIRKGMKHKLSCALGANRYIANTLLHETKEDWQDYLDEIESRLIWGEASSRQEAEALCVKPHSPSCRSFCKRITVLRRQEAFLKTDSPAQCQQQTVKRLARSFERFIAGKGGHPRFKRRGKYESIRFPQFVQLDQERGQIYLPKIGWVRYFADGRVFSTEQAAQVHAATLIRERDEYYIAFEIRTAVPAQMPGAQAAQKCVGIDRGVVNPVMTSDGAVYGAEAQERIKRAEEKISRPQRSLKRRTKGSRSWRKVNDRISRLHTKKKNINHDWQHKSSTELLQQYDSIAAEKLSIHRMTKSAGGTAEHPGTHVSAKSGLNRSLLRTCPAEFIRKVEYKAKLKGKRVVLVDLRHTSQRCSRCGYTAPKNRISQAVFICQRCGYSEHADLNAGLNIKRAGQAQLAGEASRHEASGSRNLSAAE